VESSAPLQGVSKEVLAGHIRLEGGEGELLGYMKPCCRWLGYNSSSSSNDDGERCSLYSGRVYDWPD
jgi:hypothetical protein